MDRFLSIYTVCFLISFSIAAIVCLLASLFKKVDLDAGAVGDGAIVGANVSLMPGASIGRGAMIGACSQLRDVAGENEIWFGNPAKFYKMRNQL